MKHVSSLIFVLLIANSCNTYSPEKCFTRIASLDFAASENCVTCDFRQSNGYFVYLEGVEYLVNMPVTSDTIVSVRSRNVTNGLFSACELPKDDKDRLAGICREFRQVWTIDPRNLYLQMMATTSYGDRLFFIEWMRNRNRYVALLSSKGVYSLPLFDSLLVSQSYVDNVPSLSCMEFNCLLENLYYAKIFVDDN